MGNVLHKIFRDVLNELNHLLPNLGESGSGLSHFIPEHSDFSEVVRLSAGVKKAWLKSTFKETKNVINNNTFIMDDPEKGYKMTPYMDIYKAKIQSDGSPDTIKFIIVVRVDLHNKGIIGET